LKDRNLLRGFVVENFEVVFRQPRNESATLIFHTDVEQYQFNVAADLEFALPG
jgi:hypothetical protein